jgi:DNA-binding GntR family transcriptional regulator
VSPQEDNKRSLMPRTRSEAVADELRRQIQAGILPPGARLRQMDVAQQLGVSTTPVREAFSALAREGLVRQDAHRGVIVFLPSLDELRENYEIRIALEPLAAEIATPLLTEAEIERLSGIVQEMRKSTTNPRKYVTLNRAFHTQIYAAAGRPRLLDLIENFRDAAAGYIGMLQTEVDPAYTAQVQAEHEAILAALTERAPRKTHRAVANHLQQSFRHISATVAKRDGQAVAV